MRDSFDMFGKRFSRALAVTTVASLVMATAAFADTLTADGDVLNSDTNLGISGEACDTLPDTYATRALIGFGGSDHFADSAQVSVSSAPDADAATAGITTSGNGTIIMPSNWYSAPSTGPTKVERVDQVHPMSVTIPSGIADGTYKVNMSATGAKGGGGTLSLPGTGNAFFNIQVNCADVTPVDQPPTVDAGAGVSGSEGSAIALDGTVTDDGSTLTTAWTYVPILADAGATCAFGAAAAVDTTITCTDDGTYTATLTASDGVNGPVSDSTTVTVSNAAPAPNAGADQTVNEGTLVSLSGFFTDAGSNDSHTQAWSVTANGGLITGNAAPFSFRPGDDGSYTVTYTVTDDDGGQASDTAVITVNNLGPTTSNASVTSGLVAGGFKFNASFNYSDAGWLDTHGGSSITWTVNGTDVSATSTVTPAGDTGNPAFETGSVSSSLTLGPGCYTVGVSGTALDDDGDSTAVSLTTGYETTQLDVPTLSFLSPIRDNERNIAKYGNVVPVKVAATSSCNPGQPYALDLYVTWVIGSGGEVTDSTPVIVAESVSNADSGAKMRLADGFQIYNLTTKSMTPGKDHTVQIRVGTTTGPVLLAAVLQPKK